MVAFMRGNGDAKLEGEREGGLGSTRRARKGTQAVAKLNLAILIPVQDKSMALLHPIHLDCGSNLPACKIRRGGGGRGNELIDTEVLGGQE
jgi:hypothetical protein